MPYVSVIIPAYNAADFIVGAYRSIVDQTINDWDIIFINDGSQDNTLGLIRSLAAADKRIKVIDLAVNSGPAAARNAALAIAEGEWIAVLDADDRYSPDRLEVLTNAAEQAEADIVLDNQFVVDPITSRTAFLAFEPLKDDVTILKFVDFLQNNRSDTVFDFGYLKPIIKRRWLVANSIRYSETLRLGEDLLLMFECYASGASVILLSRPYYHYYFQYSHSKRTKSPTTRTEVRYEPLVTAIEQFLKRHYSRLSCLERRLIVSACESQREMVMVSSLRRYLKKLDFLGIIGSMRHPIRLVRGIYFVRRRSFLLRRRLRRFCGLKFN
jgi:succinoglycan biosynthesis protein ExoO